MPTPSPVDISSIRLPGALAGRSAIVLGGGSVAEGWGIGKAIAVAYARAGAVVSVADVNLEAAEETVSLIAEEGGRAAAYQADVTSEQSIGQLIAQIVDKTGAVDVLHNNVGIGKAGDPAGISVEEWRKIADVNIVALHIATQAVLPHMSAAGRGVILTTSSITGLRNIGISHVPYGVTKAAASHYMRLLAIEYAHLGIRANSISVGLVETPRIHANLKNAYGPGEDYLAKRAKQVPLGFMGNAWDVAHASVFLASDMARFITGTELVIDGGLTVTTRN